jgi:hypothetical protein
MSDTLTPTNELFADVEFSARLDEWLEIRAEFGQRSENFVEAVSTFYDDGRPQEEVGVEVSYVRDITRGETWEHLNDGIADLLPVDVIEKLRLEKEAEVALGQSTRGVVELSEQKEANQFAVYGLGRHLGIYSATSRDVIVEEIAKSEIRLRRIDGLVRNNSGQLLTIMNGGSVSAGVLSEGGITIEGSSVKFPQDKPRVVYSTFLPEHPELYDRLRLVASTKDLDRDDLTVLQAPELLRVSNWFLKQVLIFGGTHIEGPVIPVSPERWAVEQGTELLRCTLVVGHMASSN